MLFNSIIFIYYFVPVVLLALSLARRSSDKRMPLLVLLAASFAFYSY